MRFGDIANTNYPLYCHLQGCSHLTLQMKRCSCKENQITNIFRWGVWMVGHKAMNKLVHCEIHWRLIWYCVFVYSGSTTFHIDQIVHRYTSQLNFILCSTTGWYKSLPSYTYTDKREPLSLVPRPRPDFISQPWRKINFSPRLRDKIWEWPGDEATTQPRYKASARTRVCRWLHCGQVHTRRKLGPTHVCKWPQGLAHSPRDFRCHAHLSSPRGSLLFFGLEGL